MISNFFFKKILKSLAVVFAMFFFSKGIAQEVTVIDHKGTKFDISSNSVTVANTAPTSPVEGDIWFDDTDPDNRVASVWDGTTWQEIIHEGTSGSLFFAAADGRPDEDNGQLFWDDTNNRLGVGTNSPTNKLHVTGAVRSQGVLNSDGTVGEPSYRFGNDSNTGIYRPAADEIGISVGGVEAIRIDETASSSTVTINETLEVDGQVLDENDSAGTAGQVLTATATGTEWASSSSLIKAIGKIASNGTVTRATAGVTVTKQGGSGHYRINLPTGMVSDGDYIIQLSQPGRSGVGNDDPGISYSNQNATGFNVIIGDNDNGGNDRTRFDSEFMFIILDL